MGDFHTKFGKVPDGSRVERFSTAGVNGTHSLLEVGNAIPVVSTVTGLVSICLGTYELVSSLAGSGKMALSGTKLMILGAAAVLPGVGLIGNLANVAFATFDGAQAVNAGISTKSC